MQYLSYRNLGEPGGPEFSETEVKALQQVLRLKMDQISRAKCSQDLVDHQINLRLHIQRKASNCAMDGAYPPDMSVLVKARPGGSDYIYSVLVGYEEPPAGIEFRRRRLLQQIYGLEKKLRCQHPLTDGMVDLCRRN